MLVCPWFFSFYYFHCLSWSLQGDGDQLISWFFFFYLCRRNDNLYLNHLNFHITYFYMVSNQSMGYILLKGGMHTFVYAQEFWCDMLIYVTKMNVRFVEYAYVVMRV